jgi:hypothetical protein
MTQLNATTQLIRADQVQPGDNLANLEEAITGVIHGEESVSFTTSTKNGAGLLITPPDQMIRINNRPAA